MKPFRYFALFFFLLFFANSFAQAGVNGTLVIPGDKNKDFIVRNTKVILVAKKQRDTATVSDDLSFSFPKAASGTGYLYLVSPALPAYTEYKFHIRKNKPTQVTLQYDKFTQSQTRPAKTPEQREADLQAGLFIARLAIDFLFIFRNLRH